MPESTEQPAVPTPPPSRPHLPEGYGVPATTEGMLAWSQVNALLEGALTYWVATVRPDERPHLIPVWGAWVDGVFYCGGSSETRWVRNLASNPAVAVHIEQDRDVVILEGHATLDTAIDLAQATRLADAFGAKYGPRFNHRPDPADFQKEGLVAIRPGLVLAWNDFPATVTRWRFPE
ncbi:MAG TPA: pyridoxamine 5'-phosphate oxidase family protein [Chloroflexia bacterium]|nr:pyridoxamine 5'-phosphate oxidase family protein [Chloroflexia bacterium]